MKRLILILLTSCVLVPGFAQKQQLPPIRKDHPRLFFNKDTWPEVERRANGPAKEHLKALLKAVDKITDNPVASGTGPLNIKAGVQADGRVVSLEHTSIPPIKQFGYEAAQTALAWRFTKDDKYLQKAKKLLRVSVDAYVEATNNRRPVEWYSTSRINALCAYDWIYEALTPQERASYILPLVEHVRLVQPEAGLNIPRQPIGSKNDGFYGMNSLLWYAGLAAYGDGFCDEEAERQLLSGYEQFLEVCQYRNDTAGDDGALISSCIDYAIGFYPYAHFNFFHTHLSATGVNVAESYPSMALLPNWVWWVWIRDMDQPWHVRHGGCGDSYHSQNIQTGEYLYEHLLQYLHFYKHSDPQSAALSEALVGYAPRKKIGVTFPAYPFIMDIDSKPSHDAEQRLKESPCKARHFESLGQFYMRSGWTKFDTYCCFTAGASQLRGHKHFDENNFTIYRGDHLALDTGDRGQQNDLNLRYYYAQSVAHNVVLVHKPGEPLPLNWGPEIDDPVANENYGGMINKGPAKILAFETGNNFTYIASDATSCYGEKCKEAVRQFVYVYPDYFIVYDRVTSSDPSYKKQWLLHTQNEPVVKDNVMKTDALHARLFCQTLLPESASIVKVGGPGKEFWVRDRNFEINPTVMERYMKSAESKGRGPYVGGWRIEVQPSVETAADRFLNVLTATDVDHLSPLKVKYVKTSAGDGVSFTLKGKKYLFVFNPDGDVGGSVTIDKITRPLASEVALQKGVIW